MDRINHISVQDVVIFGAVKDWFYIKKLDKMMISGFIPPFFLATFIALFVLIMQTLWLYIDDILGKGASLFIVIEFLFYLSMSLVPLALPIGILLASVMLFGNLGERYELSSMKSAGISLFRIMLPLIYLCAGIGMFSYLCNEFIIPLSNLKFKSRLYDLRKSSPTLNLEEGVFNDDFNGYVIHIGKKDPEGRRIEDVLIYDHQNTDSKGKLNIIKARRGEMYASDDNQFFIMKLEDGYMYQEMKKTVDRGQHPFMRSSFGTWTKIFDLRQFSMNRTDEDLFKSNQSMKNSSQLRNDIDSMQIKLEDLEEQAKDYMLVWREQELPEGDASKSDSLSHSEKKEDIQALEERRERAELLRRKIKSRGGRDLQLELKDGFEFSKGDHLFEMYAAKNHSNLLNKTMSKLQLARQRASSRVSSNKNVGKKLIKHIYELNVKYSFAVVCLVFLFIGAPMGAIVRKGGFGYPLLISIFFFIIFILLTIFCRKLADSRTLAPTLAAWVPVLALIPICTIVTYRAIKDSKFIDLSAILKWFKKADS